MECGTNHSLILLSEDKKQKIYSFGKEVEIQEEIYSVNINEIEDRSTFIGQDEKNSIS